MPRPDGFVLPARARLQQRGVTFDRYYVASAQCSSSRSVIYTGRHMPNTEIHDNDNMPYIRPLDPALGTLGSMLRTAGYYCAYQGKWHLSRAYYRSLRGAKDAGGKPERWRNTDADRQQGVHQCRHPRI